MEPEITIIDGVDIAVYESRPDGQPVVFIHGNSLSSESFRDQFASELAEKYRLIAFDLPGHGQSPPANNPENDYSVPGFHKILFGVIKKMNIRDAVFVGHSLGGHILMEAYPELEKICKAMLIFGSPPFLGANHPVERSHYPHPDFMLAFSGDLTNDQFTALAKMYIREGDHFPDLIMKDIRRTDPRMRPNLGMNTTPDKLLNEAAIVAGMNSSLAIFHGAQDQLLRAEYFNELTIPSLWKGKVHLINSGHCPQIENPEEFNRLLAEFMEDVC